MRVYDPRLGRFLSVDPLMENYPWYTPYQFAGNKPIRFIDIDGGEEGESPLFKLFIKPVLKPVNNLWIAANFYQVKFKGWKRIGNETAATTAGFVNGLNGSLSMGLYYRSPESVGINEAFYSNYYYGSTAGSMAPLPTAGSGGISPSLAIAKGGSVPAPTATTPKISINSTVLANYDQNADDHEQVDAASYTIPAEDAVDGTERLGGFATLKKNGYFETALFLKDDAGNYVTKKGTKTGREIFGMLYNEIVDRRGEVTAIIGNWTSGDNLDKFNEMLRAGASLTKAARATFTGGMAKLRDFTQVRIIGGELNKDKVTYNRVNIEFTKPQQ